MTPVAASKLPAIVAVACCCGITSPAWTAPPFGKAVAAHPGAPPSVRLDLRAPAVHEYAGLKGVAGGAWNVDNRIAASGFSTGQTREMSRAEAFARRFHREGLPVARLWENHSTLLSLGLNSRGKPGLWLVQKTH